ncbi:MAG: hypothetical protein U0935_06095 [Pirellulales bacterium]
MVRSVLSWISAATLLIMSASGCCVHRMGGPYDPCGTPEPVLYPHEAQSCRTGSCRSTLGERASCRWGCGEIYWDEWLSDPPDCCDPCDGCGNWAGPQSCCRSSPLSSLWSFLCGCRGEPCRDGEDCSGGCGRSGCSSCVSAGADEGPFADEPTLQAPLPAEEPEPAPMPARKPDPKAKRPARPYHPSYTRPASLRR